ncbi:MAG: sodium:calcium antiporter [Candidatus Melainabacteria bacterium]|nr:sodium:calcium antiporter [Candidatus Melainabacteria bacterium]
MLVEIGLILVALVIIVLAAELFTNGIEWLGQRLQLSEGVVGSVLAAVGTALPETLIPFVAVIFFHEKRGEEVGIGAIAGAPFMLSTLTLGMVGATVLLCSRAKSRTGDLQVNHVVIARDLRYFACAYTLAMLAALASPYPIARNVIAVVLFLIYPVYVWKCFQHEGEVGQAPEHLFLNRIFKCGSDRLRLIVPQILLGLGGILGGAFVFVDHVEDLSKDLRFPVLVLSLIISPIATELPEKINSVLWARQGKDTLALGNITGALVFQSCIPVAFGVAFTQWNLDSGTVLTGIVAIVSATIYMFLLNAKKLKASHLLCGMLAYALAVGFMVWLDYIDGGLEYAKPEEEEHAAPAAKAAPIVPSAVKAP